MGVEITGRCGTFSVNWHGWRYLFETAVNAGWRPAGTLPPQEIDPAGWDGDYFSNDFQVVTDEDARAWAAALMRTINLDDEEKADLENADAPRWKRERKNDRDVLLHFIRFAKHGSFYIW